MMAGMEVKTRISPFAALTDNISKVAARAVDVSHATRDIVDGLVGQEVPETASGTPMQEPCNSVGIINYQLNIISAAIESISGNINRM